MTAQILDGNSVAKKIRAAMSAQMTECKKSGLNTPGLAVVIVGDDPASHIYVRNKQQACEEVGFFSQVLHLPKTISQTELEATIEKLNHDKNIHGILVQLPLPQQIDSESIFSAVSPDKDVDGFHPYNFGLLAQGHPRFSPCTPHGIMQLLDHYDLSCHGLNATIVGCSTIVGRPLAFELLLADATVTVCHRHTKNLEEHINNADLLAVGIGKPGIVKTEWIKPGAIVIDIGTTRTADNKIIGDIDFTTAKEKAAWITPVPGGIGPMTIASLLTNTLQAAQSEF